MKLPVACFAKPLDDATLQSYEANINAYNANAEIKDCLTTILECVKVWWAIPESTAKPSNPLIVKYRGEDRTFTTLPLEQSQISQLWDVTPWHWELAAMGNILNQIQADEAQRNAERFVAFRNTLRQHLISQNFTQEQINWLESEDRKDMVKLLKIVTNKANIFTLYNTTEEQFNTENQTLQAIVDLVNAIDRGEQPSPIPEPVLEDTALRDMAYHLLWHANEITNDREPITQDKLGV